MARTGKTLQVASGSRSRSIAKAERAARRSRKLAERRAELRVQQWLDEQELRYGTQ